jgi:hypothetical protein
MDGVVWKNKERVSHSITKTKERDTILEYAYASDAGCHQREFIPALSVGPQVCCIFGEADSFRAPKKLGLTWDLGIKKDGNWHGNKYSSGVQPSNRYIIMMRICYKPLRLELRPREEYNRVGPICDMESMNSWFDILRRQTVQLRVLGHSVCLLWVLCGDVEKTFSLGLALSDLTCVYHIRTCNRRQSPHHISTLYDAS